MNNYHLRSFCGYGSEFCLEDCKNKWLKKHNIKEDWIFKLVCEKDPFYIIDDCFRGFCDFAKVHYGEYIIVYKTKKKAISMFKGIKNIKIVKIDGVINMYDGEFYYESEFND